MSRGPRRHDDRLELRLPGRAKRLLQRAAMSQGLSLSAFLLQSGLQSARACLGLGPEALLEEEEEEEAASSVA